MLVRVMLLLLYLFRVEVRHQQDTVPKPHVDICASIPRNVTS